MDIQLAELEAFRVIQQMISQVREKEVEAFFAERGYFPQEGERPIGSLPVNLRAIVFLCYMEMEKIPCRTETSLDPYLLPDIEEDEAPSYLAMLLTVLEVELNKIFPGIDYYHAQFSSDYQLYISEFDSEPEESVLVEDTNSDQVTLH